jgi:thiol-disulfide isomerase/thioredoxin/uncharacterized membrane protein YphA (DoxX/SURF4 family)
MRSSGLSPTPRRQFVPFGSPRRDIGYVHAMTDVLLATRVVLALVFLFASFAKALAPQDTERAAAAFGAGARLARSASWAVPAAEALGAVLLLFRATTRLGALLLLGLLLVFSLAIGRTLRRGEHPDCNCFGHVSSAPIAPSHLLRNGVLALAALALTLAGDSGANALAWLAEGKPSEIVLSAVSVALAALVLISYRTIRQLDARVRESEKSLRILEQLADERDRSPAGRAFESTFDDAGLGVGTVAPAVELTAATGEVVSLPGSASSQRPTVLLFLSGSCGPCRELAPRILRWTAEHGAHVRFLAMTKGRAEDNSWLTRENEGLVLFFDEASMATAAYHARWSPAAVVIAGNGRLASPLAYGADGVTELVAWTVANAEGLATNHVTAHLPPSMSARRSRNDTSPHQAIGTPVPAALDEANSPTGSVVVFWQTSCAYCAELAPDLLTYEQRADPGQPRLIVLSREDPGTQLESTVVLDWTGELNAHFGSPGTPSALLVDQSGRVASSLVSGTPAVRSLLGIPAAPAPVQASIATGSIRSA